MTRFVLLAVALFTLSGTILFHDFLLEIYYFQFSFEILLKNVLSGIKVKLLGKGIAGFLVHGASY